MVRVNSNDNSKKLKVFYDIAHRAEENLRDLSGYWNILEKQRYFINAIGIYDKMYYELMQLNNSDQDIPYKYRILDYGYPVFIRIFYDKDFASLPEVVLKPVDGELLLLLNKLLYACGIIGWMHWLIDNVNSGYMSVKRLGSHVWLKFKYKHHWNEHLEQEYITWYSQCVASYQSDEYSELQTISPVVIKEIRDTAFVWDKSFIGYSNSEQVESYFNTLALLDAQQSIHWDMFPPDASFGTIKYGDIVQSIVDFSGYSMKHLNYAVMLYCIEDNLYLENLVLNIMREDDIEKLIASNLNISETNARHILDLLRLSADKKTYYNLTSAACAPFIKVSSTQCVRSIRGFMDRPFDFMLYSLKSNHPKEWDRNTNYREQFFRSQIYSIFNDSRFICIDRPVVIKGTDGRTITDLDAVIIDKQSKQTALFQLKWQDPTNDTVFSLKSKAENYINSTRTWVNQVLHWIATSSNEEIARVLNVKKQYIHKETLFIFVMGRTHGNYSSENELSSASNVVYGQWYQFLKISTYLSQHDQLSLVNLFKIMTETVPNKTRIIERQTVFKYDRYHIHFGGGFFR